MEIILRKYSQPGLHTCYVCGVKFHSEDVLADAFNLDEFLGHVCPSCIDAGPVGIRERLRYRALAMRAQALKLIEEAEARLHAANPPVLLPLRCELDALDDIPQVAILPSVVAAQELQAMRSSRIPAHVDLSTLDTAV